MKKFATLAALAVFCLLAGCATTPQIAANFQGQIAKACGVVQPTLVSLKAMTMADPAQQVILTKLVADNGVVCNAAAAVNTATAQNLVNSSIPATLQLVGLLPLDPGMKGGVQLGLLAFQIALSSALTQFGVPTTVPTPPGAIVPATPPVPVPTAPVPAPATVALQ